MKTFLGKLSLRERFLGGVVAFLLVGILLSMVLSPQIREMGRLLDEKAMLQKLAQNPKIPPAASGSSEPSPSSSKTAESVPLSMIVSDLARLVESHQLVLSSVKPNPPEDKGDYWEYKVTVDLKGRYRNVVEFLEGTEQLPRWIMISDVRIEENGEKLPGVQVHLSAIVFKKKGEV